MVLSKLLWLNEIHSDEVRRMENDNVVLNDIDMIVIDIYYPVLFRHINLKHFVENDLFHCINGPYFK